MTDMLLYAFLGVDIVILGWLIFLTIKYRKILNRAKILFSDDDKINLSQTLEKYLKDVKEVEEHCFKLDEKAKKIRKMADNSLQKVGMVRYNPFGDVGGNQSFSLCILDDFLNGFVISSIHSREGTRVYSKSVEKGVSDYNLSEEEKKAIEIAKKR